jgi:hypothetical protein
MADGSSGFRPEPIRCVDCDAVLTDIEIEYYEVRCEGCEGKAMLVEPCQCGFCWMLDNMRPDHQDGRDHG